MNFYRNRTINPNAGKRTIKEKRDKQPMPPTSNAPAVAVRVERELTVEVPANVEGVIDSFNESTDDLGTYIIENAKDEHVPIINNVAKVSGAALSNLLISIKAEYEAMRSEGGGHEKNHDDGGSDPATGNSQGEQPTDSTQVRQPTDCLPHDEVSLNGWAGSIMRLLAEAQTLTEYNLEMFGPVHALVKDDIYSVRGILKSMVSTARAINRKEGKVFFIERRTVGKVRLERNVITCYLLTVTALPKAGKGHHNGMTHQCALMRNGYRWLAFPLDAIDSVVNGLRPISYSHRVGRMTTRIVFGSLFSHRMISQVFKTATQSQPHFDELDQIRF